jgi:hypothetical protein
MPCSSQQIYGWSNSERWDGRGVSAYGIREVHTGFWWGGSAIRSTLGRSRCKWEDDIKVGLQEVGWGDMDWIAMTQYDFCEFSNEPSGPINEGTFLTSCGIWVYWEPSWNPYCTLPEMEVTSVGLQLLELEYTLNWGKLYMPEIEGTWVGLKLRKLAYAWNWRNLSTPEIEKTWVGPKLRKLE